MIEWMKEQLPIAGDGFKAELLWLSWLQGAPATITTFETAEWQQFAHSLYPDDYMPAGNAPSQETDYCREQTLAVFGADYLPDLEMTDDLNVLAHRVIWRTDFGRRQFQSLPAKLKLTTGLLSQDTDTHARCALALTLMGEKPNLSRCRAIIAQQLDASTYHPILCATLALIFNER